MRKTEPGCAVLVVGEGVGGEESDVMGEYSKGAKTRLGNKGGSLRFGDKAGVRVGSSSGEI